MYRNLIFLALLCFTFAQAQTNSTDLQQKSMLEQYQRFLQRFNKTYSSLEELNRRFEIFSENYNKAKEGKVYGITKFMDMTPEEFKQKYLTLNATIKIDPNTTKCYFDEKKKENGRFLQYYGVPASWDWRLVGAVNPVQTQGDCGSCWAFSALANLEGVYFRKYGVLPKFSEQQLIDCDYNNQGCSGGIPHMAFEYLRSSGIDQQQFYPQQYWQGYCSYSGNSQLLVNSYTFAGTTDEEQIKQMLYETGPLSITINALYLQYYTGGIYSVPYEQCPYNPTHGVNLVGYGSENGQDYWIVRNTWGADWGEEGYFRLARGYGLCGVNQYVVSAILN